MGACLGIFGKTILAQFLAQKICSWVVFGKEFSLLFYFNNN